MAEDNRKVVIELQNVKRYFQVGEETVKALRGVSFKIYAFLMAEYSTHESYMAVVDIHTDTGDRTVRKEFESYEILPFYFYYPDPRAYRVRLCGNILDYFVFDRKLIRALGRSNTQFSKFVEC